MKIRKAVELRIIELCNERQITMHALAMHAGLPASTLKNIVNGNSKNPGIVTLKIICDGLDISVKQFFDSKIFEELEQEIS